MADAKVRNRSLLPAHRGCKRCKALRLHQAWVVQGGSYLQEAEAQRQRSQVCFLSKTIEIDPFERYLFSLWPHGCHGTAGSFFCCLHGLRSELTTRINLSTSRAIDSLEWCMNRGFVKHR